jgi:hypothetical protein
MASRQAKEDLFALDRVTNEDESNFTRSLEASNGNGNRNGGAHSIDVQRIQELARAGDESALLEEFALKALDRLAELSLTNEEESIEFLEENESELVDEVGELEKQLVS